jgi:hypothetical protein
MDYVVHGLTTNLDSSTLKGRLGAIYDVYEYCRVQLRMTSLKNPLRDPQLVILTRTLGLNFKKPGGGSLALSIAELIALYAGGFLSDGRRTRWAKLFFMFLNLGMLRHTAVQSLKVFYIIEAGKIVFLPESDIQLYYHEQFGGYILDIKVDSDTRLLNC